MRRTVQVLLAGLVLTGCGTTTTRFVATGKPIVVTLQMADGRCTVAAPLTGVFAGQSPARWQIVNGCSAPQRVIVRNFEVKTLGVSEWPFDTDATEASCPADPGRRCEIKLNVLSLEQMRELRKVDRLGAWVYRYTIALGTTTGDPEIIIDWPMGRKAAG